MSATRRRDVRVLHAVWYRTQRQQADVNQAPVAQHYRSRIRDCAWVSGTLPTVICATHDICGHQLTAIVQAHLGCRFCFSNELWETSADQRVIRKERSAFESQEKDPVEL